MSHPLQIAGERYGRLVAIERVAPHASGYTQWSFRCDCGVVTTKPVRDIRLGKIESCGCLLIEKRKVAHRSHGHTSGGAETPEYRCWKAVIARCCSPDRKDWHRYGGRGIKVCDEWRGNFASFLAHIGARPSLRHSIDRYPDKNGNYEPGNVRWATSKEQARNSRMNRIVDFDGASITLVELAERTGIKRERLAYRLNKGMDAAAAVGMG